MLKTRECTLSFGVIACGCSCQRTRRNGLTYCSCTRIGTSGSSLDALVFSVLSVKHGPQECVPEGMFDDSIDLVVWGHEHDCRIVPEPVGGKEYYITQPGSSVATSLADGEALEK